MYIKKGDNIIVISGKDKGKTGQVIKALPQEDRIVVNGVNVKKVHEKAKKSGQKGQIIDRSLPIHVSNVQLLDPKTKKPSRIGIKIEGDKKIRIAKRSGQTI
ncbi:50S ribosomal protein L24 [Candidatus Parcubacteria bacterium]|nr:50S ribosomal protein L24 [Candidatus Parcubacteria bacterium]